MPFGFFVAALVAGVTPVVAATDPNETVQAQVERRIDEEMFYPEELRTRTRTGFVHVSFELDPQGMPEKIKLERRAEWPVLNKAAAKTIKRIGPINGAKPGSRFYAVLQYDVAFGDGIDEKRKDLAQEVADIPRSALAPRRAVSAESVSGLANQQSRAIANVRGRSTNGQSESS